MAIESFADRSFPVLDRLSMHARAAISGLLLLTAGATILMGIITAEAVYPDIYTTHDNEVSDLGATRPPDSIIHEPSASIFNVTMLVSGAMILVGAGMLGARFGARGVTISVGLLGLGVLGVGIFPGDKAPWHGLFAMLAFTSGGVAAILSARVQAAPLRFVSIFLGAVALASLVVAMAQDATPLWDHLGDGGIERWIAYPVVLWLVAFGTSVISCGHEPAPDRPTG